MCNKSLGKRKKREREREKKLLKQGILLVKHNRYEGSSNANKRKTPCIYYTDVILEREGEIYRSSWLHDSGSSWLSCQEADIGSEEVGVY